MRAMAVGDRCVIYHTGGERAAVGLAEVVRAPYPDPSDPSGRWCLVDLRAGAPLARPVSLATLRADPRFAASPLLRQGRLSVVPLTGEEWAALIALAGGEGC
jgi:predicted RNA-binding protein with PUA-like domain